LQPLVRFIPPEADWREEERLRAERDGRPAAVEITVSATTTAAPTEGTSTPNIDRVRAWKEQNG
jgi:hypothetical protein